MSRFTVFVDANSLGVDRQIGRRKIRPAAGVVVGDAVAFDELRLVGVAAEDPVGLAHPGMQDGARSHLRGKPQPAGIQAVQKTREGLAFEIELLQLQMDKRSQVAEHRLLMANRSNW